MSEQTQKLLRSVFGYHQFRGKQEEVIDHVTSGGNALVLMPTGGGKSLCYQLPALVRQGLAIVVSPLIALMQDQVHALCELGIRAAFLNSSLSYEEQQAVKTKIYSGQLDLLYVAPERLTTEEFLLLLKKLPNIALFAIDEAHCVSQWGHNFRPEYFGLNVLSEQFPDVPRIALTATADDPTRKDIKKHLSLEDAPTFSTGFDRPNIRYLVGIKNQPKKQLLHFLNTEHPGDAGIVYCLSRKKVEDTAEWLSREGKNAIPYHAGLNSKTREENQRKFLYEEGVIVVATIAFGMGIDKSNVRFVCHLDLPKSLEAYYQETGRAGRDGLPATAWMTYGLGDVLTLRHMMYQSDGSEEHKWLEQRKLNAMLGYCETVTCRRQALLHYFGEKLGDSCNNCDTCLTPVRTWDGTTAAQQLLSCIYRTGQRFGAGYLVDVLLGKDNERIQRFGHDSLTTFGIGKEHSALQWHSVVRQLVAAGVISVDMDGYGGLQLTDESAPILKGEQSIKLRFDPEKSLPRRSTQKSKRSKEEIVLTTDADQTLWEALRKKRLQISKQKKIPPYMIFHDSTLKEIATTRPITLENFATISGVGDQKLRSYGNTFIEVVKEHGHNRELSINV